MVFTAILCLSFDAVSAVDVAPAPTCSLASTNANQYALNWLKRKGVTILDAPDVTVSKDICGGLWTEKGTCCQVASIKDFITKSNDKIAAKWGKYISRIARIKSKLSKAFSKIIKGVKIDSIKSRVSLMKADRKMDNSFSKVYSAVPETTEQLESLKATMENFDAKVAEFKTKGSVCFDAMKALRANMMCAVCSANAAQYTAAQSETDAKFKVDTESCSALVAKCFPIWKFNFDLATMAQFFTAIRAKGRSEKSVCSRYKSEKEVSTTDLETAKDDFANCKFEKEGDTKLTCTPAKTKTVTVEAVTARLCSKMVSITQENGYVEGDESIDADIDDKDVDEADKTADETIKDDDRSGRVTSRLLQGQTGPEVNIGLEVTDTSAYKDLLSATTGLIPTATVDTSSTVDAPQGGYGKIFSVITIFLAILAAF